jgi:hypothetical protein
LLDARRRHRRFHHNHGLLEDLTHTVGVAAEIVGAIAGSRADIDASAPVGTGHADSNVIVETEDQGTVSDFN